MNEADWIFEVDALDFDEKVVQASTHTPVLVDFWADWCQPCKMLMPVLAKVVQHYRGAVHLAKVDTDQQRELAVRLGIRSLPTVRLFCNGHAVAEFMGAQPESTVHAFLAPHLQVSSDPRREQASLAVDEGDLDKAERLLREILAQDAADPAVGVDLASVLLAKGAVDAADTVLRALPTALRDEEPTARLIRHVDFVRRACELPQEQTLVARMATSATDLEALHQLAVLRVSQGLHQEALDLLLEVLRRSRSYGDDAARREMLAVFSLLGGTDPLVLRYRALLARAMN